MDFSSLWKKVPVEIIDMFFQKDLIRKKLLKKAEARLYQFYVEENEGSQPPRVQELRCLVLMNLLKKFNQAISDGRISPKVRRSLISNFIGRIALSEGDRTDDFVKTYGTYPPNFLVISPSKKCNLFCKGCYASSSSDSSEKLSFEILDRIIQEKKDLWGSYFTIISGGEPLLYEEGGKTLFDLLEKHNDSYFMMYTNGTLINEETASRMADLGNISPAISVEGFEEETDGRRGKGVYGRILKAMDNLRKAGVPFGISVTATRHNAELVMSEEFVQRYFYEQNAIYGWLFQYMPIGRSYTLDLMVTPEQRLQMFHRGQEIIKKHGIFLVDFWNGGPYALGCVSAGRQGGYFYIDWNGAISPCTFFPYSTMNINDIYKENKNLNDVIFSPFFTAIREWQTSYGYNQPEKMDNLIVPCPMRDHHQVAVDVIKRFDAKPLDANAENAFKDEEYHRKLIEYGKTVKELTQDVWETEFLGCSKCTRGVSSAV